MNSTAHRRLLAALALALLLTTLSLAGTPAQAATWRCGYTRWIAHRGLVDTLRVENTMAAFGHAYALGARIVETDVHETADHTWVVMHDPTVDRTTNGSGPVGAMTQAQLKTLRTRDGRLGGVPTLTESLRWLRSKPALRMEIEIKDTAASDQALAKFSQLLRHYGVVDRVEVTSYGQELLSRLHAVDRGIHRALITTSQRSVAEITRFGLTVVLYRAAASRDYLALLHRHGIHVELWTVNGRTQWSGAVLDRANDVITNSGPGFHHYCWYGY